MFFFLFRYLIRIYCNGVIMGLEVGCCPKTKRCSFCFYPWLKIAITGWFSLLRLWGNCDPNEAYNKLP